MTSLAKEEVTFLLCPSLKGKRKRNRKLRQKNQKDQECVGCMGVYRYQSGIGIPFPICSSFVREIMKSTGFGGATVVSRPLKFK